MREKSEYADAWERGGAGRRELGAREALLAGTAAAVAVAWLTNVSVSCRETALDCTKPVYRSA